MKEEFNPGQHVITDGKITFKGIDIPAGTELEIVSEVEGSFGDYICDLDGWAQITVSYLNLIPESKVLECPVETPEEREYFERLESQMHSLHSKVDSLSRQIDLIATNQCGSHI